MDITLLSGGPARAYVDVSGTLTDLGHLNGGVTVTIPEPSIMDLHADEYGDTAVDGVFNGTAQPSTAVVRLAEISPENLARAIANATVVTDGTTPTKKKVLIRAIAGTKLSEYAEKYVFKPIDPATGEPDTDANNWVTIPKGVAMGAVTLSFTKGEQRVIEMTIRCLPTSSSDPTTIIYGDATAVA